MSPDNALHVDGPRVARPYGARGRYVARHFVPSSRVGKVGEPKMSISAAAVRQTYREYNATSQLGPSDWSFRQSRSNEGGRSWQNSSTVSATALAERKSEGDLHIEGSRYLVLSLLDLRLLDEIVSMLCPVVLGDGQRLFDGANRLGTELTETVSFPNGVLCLKLNPIA